MTGRQAAPDSAGRDADRRSLEAIYAPAWRRWLKEDWTAQLDNGRVADSVRDAAISNLVFRLREALRNPAGQFGRLPDLWRPRRNPDSPEGKRQKLMRSEMTTLYVEWLDEIRAYLSSKGSEVLTTGADELWGLIQEVSLEAVVRLPELVEAGHFPFERSVAPKPLVRHMATVMGDLIIDRLRSLRSVERWWMEYAAQTAHDPLDPVDDNQGRRPVSGYWLDTKATDRPTEEAALGTATETESLLRRHPYLQEWVNGEPVEAIAEKYAPTTPAQMFAKILRVVNAYDLHRFRDPLGEPSRRQWLKQYLPQVIAVRPFRGAAAWRIDELVELATAVLTLGRPPEEADWPGITQALPNPERREIGATKQRWHRLLPQRPGVALLVPWETWPRWIGPLTATVSSGLDELEQSDPEAGGHIRMAIEGLGGPEQASIALAAHHDASEPPLRDIADALTEDGVQTDGLAVARCIDALLLLPLHGTGGFDTLGDLLGSRRARQ